MPKARVSAAAVDPTLTATCGVTAIAGSIALVGGTLIGGIVVPGHDPIADTVSDLAAGRFEWIQDVSLYAYAAGLIAAAIGAADRRLDSGRWSAGVLMLALLGLCVTIIAARNEYGDGDREGIEVHIYLVYALGALHLAAPLAMARGLFAARPLFGRISQATAVIWLVGAPMFFLVPTSIDGLVERGLGLVAALWVAAIGLAVMRGAARTA
jgi:hypothetical protein